MGKVGSLQFLRSNSSLNLYLFAVDVGVKSFFICARTGLVKPGRSTTCKLSFISQSMEGLYQGLTVITLYFDGPVFYCSTRATFLFQHFGQLLHFSFSQWDACYNTDPSAFAPLGLAAHPYWSVPSRKRRTLAAHTLFFRMATTRTHATCFCGVDESGVVLFSHIGVGFPVY